MLCQILSSNQFQLSKARLIFPSNWALGLLSQHHCFTLISMGSIQVVFILEKIRIMWESILPKSTYRKSMCHVLGSVFSRITRDMLLIDDMAAEETLQVIHVVP